MTEIVDRVNSRGLTRADMGHCLHSNMSQNGPFLHTFFEKMSTFLGVIFGPFWKKRKKNPNYNEKKMAFSALFSSKNAVFTRRVTSAAKQNAQ